MQGKLFQKCTHLLYCSLLSLGGNVNTKRMSKPDMGSIFHIYTQLKRLIERLPSKSNCSSFSKQETPEIVSEALILYKIVSKVEALIVYKIVSEFRHL